MAVIHYVCASARDTSLSGTAALYAPLRTLQAYCVSPLLVAAQSPFPSPPTYPLPFPTPTGYTL